MNTRYTDMQHILTIHLRAAQRFLRTLEKQCQEEGKSEEELIKGSLAPDMFAFARQMQIVSDNAKGAVARLTGKEAPAMEDTETTLAELHERMEKTIAFLDTIKPTDYEGADEQQIVKVYFPGQFQYGSDYLQEFVYTNFFFHYTAAYAIARMQGFTLGKRDFLATLTFHPLAD